MKDKVNYLAVRVYTYCDGTRSYYYKEFSSLEKVKDYIKNDGISNVNYVLDLTDTPKLMPEVLVSLSPNRV